MSYYFRFAYVSCFSPLCSERRAPKACPIQKKGRARERKRGVTSVEGKGHGGYLSEIVISCYYRARQLSRRNTRGPLPINLSSR